MAEPKYRYRIPPCPPYDIPAMESWLEDMAAKGLHLSHDGFFCGLAIFEMGAPRKEKFRLEATATNGGLLSGEYSPDSGAVEMNAEMGWEYRARHGQFHIYSSADPHAPELHTDPRIQAMTLSALTKYLRRSLFHTLTLTALYALLYFGDILISGSIVFGTWKVLLLVFLLLWDLGRQVRTLLVLSRWRRQLHNGEPLPHRTDYRKRGWRYPASNAVRLGLWAVLIGALLSFGADYVTEENRIALEACTGTFPFPTLAEFYPGAQIEPQTGFLDSEVIAWSDFLAPENYDYSEYAELTLDGERFDCYLSLNYHETRWEWTAGMLAREFASQQGANPLEQTIARLFGNEPFTATEITVPGVDYACWYSKYHTAPHLVLQWDNMVIRVNLDVLGEGPEMEPEELAQAVLSHIR